MVGKIAGTWAQFRTEVAKCTTHHYILHLQQKGRFGRFHLRITLNYLLKIQISISSPLSLTSYLNNLSDETGNICIAFLLTQVLGWTEQALMTELHTGLDTFPTNLHFHLNDLILTHSYIAGGYFRNYKQSEPIISKATADCIPCQ